LHNQVASEKTIRDLAARISDRIGIRYTLEEQQEEAIVELLGINDC
jgi:hypothetical protein